METLSLLSDTLEHFHANKSIFVDLGIQTSWSIPKLHYLGYYTFLIQRLGTVDNFNTEYTEQLHIDLAKDVYKATNTKDEFLQMTQWLEQQEKILHHERYVTWHLAGSPPMLASHSIDVEHPTDRLKMTKHPSKKNVCLEKLATDYSTLLFVNALARFTVKWCNPMFTAAQIEHASGYVGFPFGYDSHVLPLL